MASRAIVMTRRAHISLSKISFKFSLRRTATPLISFAHSNTCLRAHKSSLSRHWYFCADYSRERWQKSMEEKGIQLSLERGQRGLTIFGRGRATIDEIKLQSN